MAEIEQNVWCDHGTYLLSQLENLVHNKSKDIDTLWSGPCKPSNVVNKVIKCRSKRLVRRTSAFHLQIPSRQMLAHIVNPRHSIPFREE
jgi:hypothetical protein